MIRRVMTINGRRTSVRMEKGFWEALDDVARRRGLAVADLVSEIDETRGDAPLTGALRVMAVSYFRELLHGTARPAGGRRGNHYDSRQQDNERANHRQHIGHLPEQQPA